VALNDDLRRVMSSERTRIELNEMEAALKDLSLEEGISFQNLARKLRAAQELQIKLVRLAIGRERDAINDQ